MDDPDDRPPVDPAVRHAVINGDLFCGCGYNLYGQAVTRDERLGFPVVRCPECGQWHPGGAASTAGSVWLGRLASAIVSLWLSVVFVVAFLCGAIAIGMTFGYFESFTGYASFDPVTGRPIVEEYVPVYDADGDPTNESEYVYRFAGTDELVPLPEDGSVVVHLRGDRDYDQRRVPFDSVPIEALNYWGDPPSWWTTASSAFFAALLGGILGVLQAAALWHLAWPRKLVPPLIVVGAVVAIFAASNLDDGSFGPAGGVAWRALAVVPGTMLIAWVVGLVVGRRVARGTATLLLPPKPRQALAHLWHADGKTLPLAIAATLALIGCSRGPEPTPLAELYPGRSERPVVVLPGYLGSRLVDADGTIVWGSFAGDYANAGRPDGARRTALPMAQGVPLGELRDEVEPAGLVRQLRADALFVPFRVDVYRGMLDGLSPLNVRTFSYDWRRDNAEAANRLYRALARLKAETGMEADVVAHSMGGLVVRYMLRYGDAPLPADGSPPELTWKGADVVRKAVLIAPPSAGSVGALGQLADGKKFGRGTPAFWLPEMPAAVVGTMAGVYQLLPRPRDAMIVDEHGDPVPIYDPAFWVAHDLGLADPDEGRTLAWLLPGVDDPAARAEVALDHLRKCLALTEQFHRALDAPATRPAGVELHLVAADAFATEARMQVDADGDVRTIERGPGDGAVLRSSALAAEFDSVTFVTAGHRDLTSDRDVLDTVLYLLRDGGDGDRVAP